MGRSRFYKKSYFASKFLLFCTVGDAAFFLGLVTAVSTVTFTVTLPDGVDTLGFVTPRVKIHFF
jgi:hypothetical protein